MTMIGKFSFSFYIILTIQKFKSSHILTKIGKVQYLLGSKFELFLTKIFLREESLSTKL